MPEYKSNNTTMEAGNRWKMSPRDHFNKNTYRDVKKNVFPSKSPHKYKQKVNEPPIDWSEGYL